MEHAYIYDGLRTPIGRHAGGLAPMRPDDLLAGVIKTLVGRNPFKPGDYEDAVVGCTNQAGKDARNVARHAALLAEGLPCESFLDTGARYDTNIRRPQRTDYVSLVWEAEACAELVVAGPRLAEARRRVGALGV